MQSLPQPSRLLIRSNVNIDALHARVACEIEGSHHLHTQIRTRVDGRGRWLYVKIRRGGVDEQPKWSD